MSNYLLEELLPLIILTFNGLQYRWHLFLKIYHFKMKTSMNHYCELIYFPEKCGQYQIKEPRRIPDKEALKRHFTYFMGFIRIVSFWWF